MRFNNRACALMDIPDLPQGAFEHIGDGKIKPQGGGGGGIPIVSDIGKGIESVAQGISDVGVSFDKAVTQPVGKGLSEVDTFVNRELPGGWTLPAVIAVAYMTGYLDPTVFGAEGAALGTAEGATAAGNAAYSSAIANGSTVAEATAAANAAASSYATGASGAGLLDAAALAESGTTAGMGAAANTGLPAGTSTLGSSGFVGLDAVTAAELGLSGESALGTAGTSGDVLAGIPTVSEGAPIYDYSTEATLTPGGNVVPATTLPSEMAAIDAQIAAAGKEAAAALPMKISPMQAIQGARLATGLLGGGQQQAQQLPQMASARNMMPQGAVDYSGIYNLLALQRARNPNSLLG